jgi:hypothetical protein
MDTQELQQHVQVRVQHLCSLGEAGQRVEVGLAHEQLQVGGALGQIRLRLVVVHRPQVRNHVRKQLQGSTPKSACGRRGDCDCSVWRLLR